MMKEIILVIVVVILCMVWSRAENKQRHKQIEKSFSDRESLTLEQFYSHYFKDKGIPFSTVAGVIKTLEEQLDANLSRVRPDDDFSKNLQFFWAYDDMADVAVVVALEKYFGIVISDNEAESAHTVEDIINLIQVKVEERGTTLS